MSKEKDVSAFPYHIGNKGALGMTLRDYFAAKLMHAVIGSLNGSVTGEEKPGDFDYYAECAYQMADAMLRARGQ
ncbi:hypothetical protein [Pantoea sp. ACRSB]|uniref:hypothetical protein n=1 Tax=Pantoea sp. ACRSB TaxID=2918207 RepID=UPI002892CCC6|nr:hypothetical protein [Pantoea sp. ACRSB]MCG7388794.1 hypothetical protein [Pantoea sp. ACRSB]